MTSQTSSDTAKHNTLTDNMPNDWKSADSGDVQHVAGLMCLDSITDGKSREAAAQHRNHSQRMATGAKPDTRIAER